MVIHGAFFRLASATWHFFLSLTPRVLLEYVSCRPSAHLPWRLFFVFFLLWPYCFGSFFRYLMPSLPCVFPLVSPSYPHLPCHHQSYLAQGKSVPTLPIKSLSVTLALKGLSWQVRLLQSTLCSFLPCCSHWLPLAVLSPPLWSCEATG